MLYSQTGPRRIFPGISAFLCLVACLFLIGCRNEQVITDEPRTDTDSGIAFYREKLSSSDKHYPSFALLADALLRKSRETGDHTLIPEARRNVEASMAIQPNYVAMKTMAMICNHTHRFADALSWAEKAAGASAEGLTRDSDLSAIMVESYLGLGEVEKALIVLDQLREIGKKEDDFYSASARGTVLKAQNKIDEAVEAFEASREFAAKEGANAGVVWSNVMAAGCLLDSGRTSEAKPYLELANAMDPHNSVLAIHKAEFLAASNKPKEALLIYEDLLKVSDDPEIHRRAFVIGRDHGRSVSADAHFEAAEKGFQKIIDAGEIYSLGPLAQLYCDKGTDVEKARQYALRNFEFKKDVEAQDTLQCTERMGS